MYMLKQSSKSFKWIAVCICSEFLFEAVGCGHVNKMVSSHLSAGSLVHSCTLFQRLELARLGLGSWLCLELVPG